MKFIQPEGQWSNFKRRTVGLNSEYTFFPRLIFNND